MLSNTALGFLSTAYTVSGALMQPIFGYVTDRVGPRWVVAGGVAWMGLAYTMGILTPGRTALVFLVLASLGSGAFHPAGTMQATARGRTHFIGQETTATSYFFLFGQVGLFVGPFVAGYLLDSNGIRGLLTLPALAVPIGLLAAWQLRRGAPPRAREASSKSCSPARAAGEPGHGGDCWLSSPLRAPGSSRARSHSCPSTSAIWVWPPASMAACRGCLWGDQLWG